MKIVITVKDVMRMNNEFVCFCLDNGYSAGALKTQQYDQKI